MAWGKFVDMELDDDDKLDAPTPIPMEKKPDYPYGLRICLTEKELAKLGLTHDCEVGDEIELGIRACVTSMTCADSDGSDYRQPGHTCRIELQIKEIALDE